MYKVLAALAWPHTIYYIYMYLNFSVFSVWVKSLNNPTSTLQHIQNIIQMKKKIFWPFASSLALFMQMLNTYDDLLTRLHTNLLILMLTPFQLLYSSLISENQRIFVSGFCSCEDRFYQKAEKSHTLVLALARFSSIFSLSLSTSSLLPLSTTISSSLNGSPHYNTNIIFQIRDS